MRISLSKFLQLRLNVFLFKRLNWQFVYLYTILLGKLYFLLLNRKERCKIEDAVEAVFQVRKSKSETKIIKRNVLQGILFHYYEKLFNAYENIDELKNFFEESIEVHCLKKLDNALRNGKGVLFVTAHYGGIEYIPIFLALKHYPISVIAKFKTEELKETLYQKTKDIGLKIIDADQKNGVLSSIIQELKHNRIVFIECDEIEEWKPSQKERISFLGKRIGVDRTINVIQRRTGAEVILGFLHRLTLQNYRLILEDYRKMVLQLSKTPLSIGGVVLKFFEQYIYSYPEAWYQWINFAKIQTLPISDIKAEKPATLSLLKPAFGEIS